ncbi:MAG: FAD-dependent oxidoreductase [Proteobacteria bacterium]|nr:FAD-dependent oxidoreductase [Pseudomonadota bacterium]MDA1059938.1 FAD-dependent oxidoreductase [Pseudomonadota bacterium]
MTQRWDVIVVGGGTAGMPAATFAAERGARVLVIEAAADVGGTLHLSTGQLSAAGTRLQAQKGVSDATDAHYDDIMRISNNTADATLVRLAVDHAAETFDWLQDNGFVPLDEHPVLGKAHEPYSERRYYWGIDGGLTILETLRGPFQAQVDAGQVAVKLSTEVTALVTDTKGAVVGVKTKGPDGDATIHGENVVLACGGYSSNGQMFEELSGFPQYFNGAYPYSQGAGLRLGESVGGWLRGHEHYLCGYGAVLDSDTIPAGMTVRPLHHPTMRQPWEIHVNVRGERFVQEDVDSVDVREHALLAQPALRRWVIYDDAIAKASPPQFADGSKEQEAAFFDTHPMFTKADSLADLAAATGIDAAGLAASVAAYNAGIEKGTPDPMGRQHRPLAIKSAPFYAIRVQGTSISSTVGLAVDGDLRVIDKNNAPIANLYAAGELLGSGQTMGGAFCGGMMATPALTFGRLLGQRLLTWEDRAAQAAE